MEMSFDETLNTLNLDTSIQLGPTSAGNTHEFTSMLPDVSFKGQFFGKKIFELARGEIGP